MAKFGDLSDYKVEGNINYSFSENSQKMKLLDGSLRVKEKRERSNKDLVDEDQIGHIFNINPKLEGDVLLDPHETAPEIAGSEEEPDVILKAELATFHPAKHNEDSIGASLRMDIGQDSTSNSLLKPLFWSVAAGLDISNAAKQSRDTTKLRANFSNDLFNRQPIQIGGGLAQFSLEIMENKKPKWWQDLFGLLGSEQGKKLTSAFGFPGIANEAIKVLNELFNQFSAEQDPILKSPRFIFALSKYAQDEYLLGNPRIKIGVINKGFSIVVPKQYKHQFEKEDPIFYNTYGVALPKDMDINEYLETGLDPFADIPYAVIKIRTKQTKIDVTI
ncbi:MAG: hypothetical protein ABJV04_16130 [Aliiglaciecola sp.]|uniref:hypothetical protein n=1 Tax=Aliiglaciecola sp. TaxID=1872441 RepID=UPI00329A3810